MTATPETGILVIADLTGYTAYLSRSELEHAPAIAGDLLETIVGRLEPPFRLAKFEGDAAFLFAEDGRADASLLLDAIEASYIAFRRRLRSIDRASSCSCNSGWLPRAARRDNAYREYGEPDVEHLRLLIDLRRLDVPLEDAARVAGWCHSGHCADASTELPQLIGERRALLADRIVGLQALDARLADLQRHLERPRGSLAVIDTAAPCCPAADAVVASAEGACASCSPASDAI